MDHASGLKVVLDRMHVRQLIMHRPWEHALGIRPQFVHPRLTIGGLRSALEEAVAFASDLEAMAISKRIPIIEPFTGHVTMDGVLTVLGPSVEYYRSLLPEFRNTPASRMPTLASLLSKAVDATPHAPSLIQESQQLETLDDSGVTSAENNSSAIILLRVDGDSVLFSADAGIPALGHAADFAERLGIDLRQLSAFQVPHHGSRANIGPTLLDRIVAPNNYVSVAVDAAPKHPSQRVVNAIVRRGRDVYVTRGVTLHHSKYAPPRPGWISAPALAFTPTFPE